jgi:hypothetical protein
VRDVRPIKCFCCDLNWSRIDDGGRSVAASAPRDWAFVDPQEYFDWHVDFGNNVTFCQAYAFGGYAFYPSKLGPVAPGQGSELLPRLFELTKAADMPFWSYFNVGADLITCALRDHWTVPTSAEVGGPGFLGPETPWTELLCARIREFLTDYPVDWLLFDWFVYGSLQPDTFRVQPAWFTEGPFEEIIGRPMPSEADQITPEENLAYKRETLARQFRSIRDAVKETSPDTKIAFNVPYREPDEAIWVGHPMVTESDGIFAECSRDDVMEWLMGLKRPEQRMMTTIIGRPDDGECFPDSWRKWHERGCDFFGYAWGTPPDFRPHPSYAADLDIVRRAFHQIG